MANGRFPRFLRTALERDSGLYPVVAVMGARQVGKSTLCREYADDHGFTYRTLDDLDVLEQAKHDPEGLLAALGDSGVFLDEVQRAPNLFLAIKAIVDRDQRPGQYILSGSSQPRISSSIGESLLGRAVYRTLRPLTLSEFRFDEEYAGWDFLFGPDQSAIIKELEQRAEASGAPNWKEVVATGGFPRAALFPVENRAQYFDDYVRVFASRDIREVIGVESSDRFEGFLRLVAAWTGQELNASGLSRDLGIPVNTVRRWIEALQRSYLVELLQPYSRNASQRVIKAPKILLVDPALALAAAGESEPTGFHLENLIANDLCVWREAVPGRSVYHWRLQGGQEVDFILEQKRQLIPVEIKAGVSVGRSEARHIRTFRDTHPNSPRGLLLSCDPNVREVAPGIVAAPWWSIL